MKKGILIVVLVLLLLGSTFPALAQNQPAGKPALSLEDVYVVHGDFIGIHVVGAAKFNPYEELAGDFVLGGGNPWTGDFSLVVYPPKDRAGNTATEWNITIRGKTYPVHVGNDYWLVPDYTLRRIGLTRGDAVIHVAPGLLDADNIQVVGGVVHLFKESVYEIVVPSNWKAANVYVNTVALKVFPFTEYVLELKTVP